jgi:hypothetical protein
MSKQRRKRSTAYKRLRTAAVRAARRLRRRAKRADKTINRRFRRAVGKAESRIVRAAKRTRRAALRTAKQSPRKIRRNLKAGKRTAKALSRRLRVNARKAPRVIRKRLKTLQKAYQKRQKARLLARTKMRITAEMEFGAIRGAQATQAAGNTGGSRPGEPPKMRTGKGRSSIMAELRRKGKYKLESRVFVDKKIAPYMALHEFRPDKKQRPFLKPSVNENMRLLGNIIGQNLRELATAQPRRKAGVN